MDRQEEFNYLLSKYQQGICSPGELERLYAWLDQRAAAGQEPGFGSEEERKATGERMKQAILEGILRTGAGDAGARPVTGSVVEMGVNADAVVGLEKTGAMGRKKPGMRLYMFRVGVVAAAVLAIIAGAYLLSRVPAEVVLATAAGETKKVPLPDGSTVWLNDNSELAFRKDFADNRTIEIKHGEAFFEVKKDVRHPFIVRSHELRTVVLGTSFSVKMVADADIKVSVKTGKVLVSRKRDTLGFVQPMQRLRYAAMTGRVVMDTVMADEADAWTHGAIFLQNAGIGEVEQLLREHYKVSITNEHHSYAGEYYLQVRSDIDLPQLLKILNLLGTKNQVRFILKDQKIIIQ